MSDRSSLAVILAAGKSSRISQLTFDRPKTLLSVNGQSIVIRLCHFLSRIASRTVVIGGRHAAAIEDHLSGLFQNVTIVADDLAPEMGNTYSMMLGIKDFMASSEKSIILVEGDIVLTESAFMRFANHTSENKFALIKTGIQGSDDKVCIDELTKKMVITKEPTGKQFLLGKFIGLTTLSRSRAIAVYQAAIGSESKPYVEVLQNFLCLEEELVLIPDGQADEIDNAVDYQRVLFDSELAKPVAISKRLNGSSQLHFSGPLKRFIGVYDLVGARLAQRAGFDGMWLGSFQISLSQGLSDDASYDNFLALRLARHLRASGMLAPLIVDATSGARDWNEARTFVEECLQLDISAICVDDQGMQRSCSLIAGQAKELISVEEYKNRIADLAGLTNGALQIIARTEALNAGRSVSEVSDRLHAAIEAGASAVIPHYVESNIEEIRSFLNSNKFSKPVVLIPTRLLHVPLEEFKSMGCAAVVYANIDLRLRFTTLLEAYARISSLGHVAETEITRLFDPVQLSDNI